MSSHESLEASLLASHILTSVLSRAAQQIARPNSSEGAQVIWSVSAVVPLPGASRAVFVLRVHSYNGSPETYREDQIFAPKAVFGTLPVLCYRDRCTMLGMCLYSQWPQILEKNMLIQWKHYRFNGIWIWTINNTYIHIYLQRERLISCSWIVNTNMQITEDI